MSRFLNEKFKTLDPYVPGEQPQDKSYVKLNTNESPFPPSPKVVAALNAAEAGKLNLYSDPLAKRLVKSIASFYGAAEKNVFVGNGSDEVLAFAFDAFCGANKGMAGPEIGYGFYPVFCEMFSVKWTPVPLRSDFSIDVSGFKGLKENIIIANPNAQTGLFLPVSDIKTLLCENSDRLVIVDEAYCDFGGESAASLLGEFQNLLIISTVSKSRQLAGGRIGYALGSEELIEDLNKLKYSFNPYNIDRLNIVAGAEAFDDREYFDLTRKAVAAEREKTKKRLKALGFSVTDSLANFVLASRAGIGGKELYLSLKEKGVLVRFLSDEKLKNWVRISVGSARQMDFLFSKIEEVLKENDL